ncbi:hypothetical protein FOZ62_015898, partial [Perkinsus olseni]
SLGDVNHIRLEVFSELSAYDPTVFPPPSTTPPSTPESSVPSTHEVPLGPIQEEKGEGQKKKVETEALVLRDDTYARKMEAERQQQEALATQGEGKRKTLNKSLAAIDEQYSANDGYTDLMNSTRPKNAVSG